jgi:ribosomal-protein-alanine N-acetyltransferase
MRTPTGGRSRLRVRPWHGDRQVAHVAPAGDLLGPLSTRDVERSLRDLRRSGYRSAITAALHRADRAPFLQSGFVEIERLHLLQHRFDHLVAATPASGVDLRRGRRRDHAEVLAVDAEAFAPFWRLDQAGLAEALTATTSVHFQVARSGDAIVGYAVCGRAGSRGYVQRLAVHPASQGQRIGAALLYDGLRWLRRWGARDALVNTQEGNRRSLRLYHQAGFVLQADGLSVLRIDLDDVPAAGRAAATPAGRYAPGAGR